MFTSNRFRLPLFAVLALPLLQACGDGAEPQSPQSAKSVTETVEADPAPETEVAASEPASDEQVQEIDPESLEASATVEITQYTVAFGGSGTMGGGTLTSDGKEYPFKIAGLGYGGIGATAIDATGTVYNLPSVDDFPGTYGNARLGMTAGESGGGRLWLRDPDGVVIELVSEMRGLALAGGVDGLLISWDEEDSDVDKAMDKSEEVVGGGIEAGADVVEEGVDKVKGWLKGD